VTALMISQPTLAFLRTAVWYACLPHVCGRRLLADPEATDAGDLTHRLTSLVLPQAAGMTSGLSPDLAASTYTTLPALAAAVVAAQLSEHASTAVRLRRRALAAAYLSTWLHGVQEPLVTSTAVAAGAGSDGADGDGTAAAASSGSAAAHAPAPGGIRFGSFGDHSDDSDGDFMGAQVVTRPAGRPGHGAAVGTTRPAPVRAAGVAGTGPAAPVAADAVGKPHASGTGLVVDEPAKPRAQALFLPLGGSGSGTGVGGGAAAMPVPPAGQSKTARGRSRSPQDVTESIGDSRAGRHGGDKPKRAATMGVRKGGRTDGEHDHSPRHHHDVESGGAGTHERRGHRHRTDGGGGGEEPSSKSHSKEKRKHKHSRSTHGALKMRQEVARAAHALDDLDSPASVALGPSAATLAAAPPPPVPVPSFSAGRAGPGPTRPSPVAGVGGGGAGTSRPLVAGVGAMVAPAVAAAPPLPPPPPSAPPVVAVGDAAGALPSPSRSRPDWHSGRALQIGASPDSMRHLPPEPMPSAAAMAAQAALVVEDEIGIDDAVF